MSAPHIDRPGVQSGALSGQGLLVFGRTGQVALALQRLAPEALFLDRAAADLADPEACGAAILAQRPQAVINAAAWTAVDRAETEEALAMRINGSAPAAMARACAALQIPLVHISSDYVFDGAGTQPFQPGDRTAPLGAYGRSKLAGEQGVQAAGCPFAVLRTSWVFSADGANFVKTMLRLGRERAVLRVVADQIGGPTPASAIAEACLDIASQLCRDPGKSGVYHFAGAPDVSWAAFAAEIMTRAKLPCQIEGIATADYPTPAQRPANSRLDCTGTEAIFGLARPDWATALTQVLRELAP